jgi:hypothetical protein
MKLNVLTLIANLLILCGLAALREILGIKQLR